MFLFSLTRARCLSDHCVANVTVIVPLITEDGEAKLLTHRHSVSQTFRPRTFVEQMSSPQSYSGPRLIKKKSHRLSLVPHSLYKPLRDTWLRIDFLKSIDLIQNTSQPVTRHRHVKMVIRHIACIIVTWDEKHTLRSVPCDHLLWTECSHHQPACSDRVV